MNIGDMVFPKVQDRYNGWGLASDFESVVGAWRKNEGRPKTSRSYAGNFSPGEVGLVVDLMEEFAQIITSTTIGWIPIKALDN